MFAGTGRLGADRTVTVDLTDGGTAELTGDAVILASGSVPRTIPGFEVDGGPVFTSDEVFEIGEVPDADGRHRRWRHRL